MLKKIVFWMLLLGCMVTTSGCVPAGMCFQMVASCLFMDKIDREADKMEMRVHKDIYHKKYDQALKRIEKFRQKYPNLPSGINSNTASTEVQVYEAQKRYDLAIKTLEESLKITPDPLDSWNYNRLGKLYLKQKQNEKAEDAFKTAQELSECDLQMQRAYAYQNADMNDKAIEIYTQLIAKFSNYSIIYTRLGYVYCLKGDIKQAIFNYDQALKINPEEDDDRIQIGSLYAIIGEREKAKEMFNLISYPSCMVNMAKNICKYLDSDSYRKNIQQNMES
ncbi:tetratricopeptide repeat protein, partial [Candidatus Desantisbacteria bacterium]|nr:tetratricopeptide repeat protein [Candidatus Desantisbacteria bacterium]